MKWYKIREWRTNNAQIIKFGKIKWNSVDIKEASKDFIPGKWLQQQLQKKNEKEMDSMLMFMEINHMSGWYILMK